MTSGAEKVQCRVQAFGITLSLLLHGILLWFFSQSAMPHHQVSQLALQPMMLVLIKEPAPSAPPKSTPTPDKKSSLQKSNALRNDTIKPQASEKPVPVLNSMVTAEALDGNTKREASGLAPANAAQEQRGSTSGTAGLQLDYRGGKKPQPSYAEQANEKLNPDERPNALAKGIKRAEIPECSKDQVSGGLFALPTIIYRASAGKCNF